MVTGPLPAVVSVVEKINEPRYPSFKGIMAAKKKPVQTLALADLGVDTGAAGWPGRGPPWLISPPSRRARPGRS